MYDNYSTIIKNIMDLEIVKRLRQFINKLSVEGFIEQDGSIRRFLYGLLSPYGVFYDFVQYYHTGTPTEDIYDILLCMKAGAIEIRSLAAALLVLRNKVVHRCPITVKKIRNTVNKFIEFIERKEYVIECELFLLFKMEELIILMLDVKKPLENINVDDMDETHLHRLIWFREKNIDLTDKKILILNENLESRIITFKSWDYDFIIGDSNSLFARVITDDNQEEKTLKWYREYGYRDFLKGVKIRRNDEIFTVKHFRGTNVFGIDTNRIERKVGNNNIVSILDKNGNIVKI